MLASRSELTAVLIGLFEATSSLSSIVIKGCAAWNFKHFKILFSTSWFVTSHLLNQSWSAAQTSVKWETDVLAVETSLMVVVFLLQSFHFSTRQAQCDYLEETGLLLWKGRLLQVFPGRVLCFTFFFFKSWVSWQDSFLSSAQCSTGTCRHFLMWLVGLFCMFLG